MKYATWPTWEVCGLSVHWAKGRLFLKEDDVADYRDVRINQEHLRPPDNQGQARIAPSDLSALVDNLV